MIEVVRRGPCPARHRRNPSSVKVKLAEPAMLDPRQLDHKKLPKSLHMRELQHTLALISALPASGHASECGLPPRSNGRLDRHMEVFAWLLVNCAGLALALRVADAGVRSG